MLTIAHLPMSNRAPHVRPKAKATRLTHAERERRAQAVRLLKIADFKPDELAKLFELSARHVERILSR